MTLARSAVPASSPGGAAAGSAELQRFINAGRLASAVSHDLLSALGVAQTDVGFLCELFDQRARDPDLRDAAEDAREAISRAVARVAAVLSLARDRRGEIAPLDVKEVIAAALFDLDARLGGLDVACDFQAVPFALAERGALLQTMVSVLLDAADSTPVRGRIAHALGSEPGSVVITVDDEGPSPIAPELLASRPGSTLSLCREVMRSFGGDLITAAGPLGGKRVTLRLCTGRVSSEA